MGLSEIMKKFIIVLPKNKQFDDDSVDNINNFNKMYSY